MTASWVNTKEFEQTYNATFDLLSSARDYIAGRKKVEKDIEPQTRLLASGHISKLTVQLSTIMSWLLLNKAAHAGEITLDELNQEGIELLPRLKDTPPLPEAEDVPEDLISLLEKSFSLFEDVEQIQQRVNDETLLH